MRQFIHILVFMAMVTVGISPACAFVSGGSNGGSYIEICRGVDIVRIAIDENGQAVEVDGEGGESSSHQQMVDACSFCFSQTHLKQLSDLRSDFSSSIARVRGGVVYGHGGQVYALPPRSAHGVRAPPLFS